MSYALARDSEQDLADRNQLQVVGVEPDGSVQLSSGSILTQRELEILAHMAAGRSNPEIAAALFLSVHTIEYYCTGIYQKLGVRNRMEASLLCIRLGVVAVPTSDSPRATNRAIQDAPEPDDRLVSTDMNRAGRVFGKMIGAGILGSVLLVASVVVVAVGAFGNLPILTNDGDEGERVNADSQGGAPRIHVAQAVTTSVLPDVGRAPLASRGDSGFMVDLIDDYDAGGSRVFVYSVSTSSDVRFTDMLGIPRVINPDNSIVLPSEYGPIHQESPVRQYQGKAVEAAIFKASAIQNGAVLRFGPFLQGLTEGIQLETTGDDAGAGLDLVIGGEPFVVVLSHLDNNLAEIRFQPLLNDGGIVASHPGSKISATVDGRAMRELRGSTSFAKTEDLDVNANQSTFVLEGVVNGTSALSLEVDTIGRVVKGKWDFQLN
ncbi:MAG: hypothetical protein GEU75_13475 [Dehalococcoidia bacterium]|nr:hypothetical protein [Dehalococcoidia bacterium]